MARRGRSRLLRRPDHDLVHDLLQRGTIPTRNHVFWVEKFSANRRRDARKIKALRNLGFHVAVIWECQGLDASALECMIGRIAARQYGRKARSVSV